MRTKHGTARLARQLEKDGLVTDAIHGDKTQQARMEALAAFKEGKLQVLVATDVAARGLDIDDLPLVVNYELPHVPEDYIHRIGRTGRAGASGEAISLVAPDEERYLADIERLLKKKVEVVTRRGIRSRGRPLRQARARDRARSPASARHARRARLRKAKSAPAAERARPRARERAQPDRSAAAGTEPWRLAARGARARLCAQSRSAAAARERRLRRRTTPHRRVVRPRQAGPRAADEAQGQRARKGLTATHGCTADRHR